ncbi:MAG: CbiX/SirB N-terminal domain-containing protein [Rhodoferax sp.]|nr:CbiX/SirB N-terminal domain-containing protein [Rhodoferax sp.]
MPHAIILFAHGSRDPLWRLPVEAVEQRVRELDPAVAVCCAYLELMEPDLPAAVRDLVAAGVDRIGVVPMFLGVGRHAREDLPMLMAALARDYPQVEFDTQPSIGENLRVIALLAEIALSKPA